jgi:hypothetical protein
MMANKDDKILKPMEWLGIIVAGIGVVAVLGWSASSVNTKQQAKEALTSIEGCNKVGIFVDQSSAHGIEVRDMYECSDYNASAGAFKRIVVK